MQATLPDNAGDIQLYDLFGNKLPFDGRTLKLDFAPSYLTWKGGTAESVRAALSSAAIRGGKPFRVERTLLLNDADGKSAKLMLNVRNMSGKAIDSATASIASESFAEGIVKLDAGSFKAMESKELDAPVSLDAKLSGKAKLKVDISGADKPFSSMEDASSVKFVQLEEGLSSPAFQIEKPVIGKPESPDDLSAKFTISYERDDLLLDVKVRDDKPSQPSVRGPWDEDALQIYIDAAPMSCGANYPDYAGTTYQIVVAAYRDGQDRVSSSGFPGKIDADVKHAPDGYEVKVRIPLSDIPGLAPIGGKMIGFDISVEDSDATSRKTEIVWNGTADNYRNRSQFAIVQFKKAGK